MSKGDLPTALYELECAKQELQKATANLHIAQARVTLIRSSWGEDSPSKQDFVPFKESATRADTVVTSGGGGPQYKAPTPPKRTENPVKHISSKKSTVTFDCPKEKPEVNENLEKIVTKLLQEEPNMDDAGLYQCINNLLRMLVIRNKQVMVYKEELPAKLFDTLYGIIQEHLGEGKGYVSNTMAGDNSRFVNDYEIHGESLEWLPRDVLSTKKNDTWLKMGQLYRFYKTHDIKA